jgi:hypothetical protein
MSLVLATVANVILLFLAIILLPTLMIRNNTVFKAKKAALDLCRVHLMRRGETLMYLINNSRDSHERMLFDFTCWNKEQFMKKYYKALINLVDMDNKW